MLSLRRRELRRCGAPLLEYFCCKSGLFCLHPSTRGVHLIPPNDYQYYPFGPILHLPISSSHSVHRAAIFSPAAHAQNHPSSTAITSIRTHNVLLVHYRPGRSTERCPPSVRPRHSRLKSFSSHSGGSCCCQATTSDRAEHQAVRRWSRQAGCVDHLYVSDDETRGAVR